METVVASVYNMKMCAVSRIREDVERIHDKSCRLTAALDSRIFLTIPKKTFKLPSTVSMKVAIVFALPKVLALLFESHKHL